MGIIERLWRFLPDKCQDKDCQKNGVRGNENVIDGIKYCDDCSVSYCEHGKKWNRCDKGCIGY